MIGLSSIIAKTWRDNLILNNYSNWEYEKY